MHQSTLFIPFLPNIDPFVKSCLHGNKAFQSTLRETAFDWYARLPAGTKNSWADEEEKFLTHFLDEDDKSTTAQLCATKQAHNDSVDSFIKRWRALAVK